MIDELDLVTGIQLKVCTIPFHQKKRNSFAISEMFSCELKFDSDYLKRCFVVDQLIGLQQNLKFAILNFL